MTPTKEMIEAAATFLHENQACPSWNELAQGALTAALSPELLSKDQWKGMESAPKDGTKIDLMFPGVRGRTINCFWMNDKVHHGWVWLTPTWDKGELLPESKWMVNCYPNMEPIAWMYPPPPPASKE